MTARSRGSLLVQIQPFLVVTSKDIILLDTGLGFNHHAGDQLQLVKNLAENGFQTGDVTKVLMSHLHKDHTGGMVNPTTGKPVFENATYYIQEREVAYARERNAPSYDRSGIDSVFSGKVTLLKEDSGTIEGYIDYEVTGAHSKFHQVFWIRENREIVFFGADDASQYQQMKHRFAAKYDFDGKKAMELRTKWWEQGKKEQWRFLFYHDTQRPTVIPDRAE